MTLEKFVEKNNLTLVHIQKQTRETGIQGPNQRNRQKIIREKTLHGYSLRSMRNDQVTIQVGNTTIYLNDAPHVYNELKVARQVLILIIRTFGPLVIYGAAGTRVIEVPKNLR